jgi:urease accessory protein
MFMKHLKHTPQLIAAVALGLVATAASAHPGAHAASSGFVAGFAHPLLGWDHLLATLAVGLWAARLCGRVSWAIPVAFVCALASGAVLAWSGVVLPAVETGLALSVLLLGLLVATAPAVGVAAGVALVGAFALLHGHAHGLEMPPTAAPLVYALGFVLATVSVYWAALIFGRRASAALAAAGAAIATAGAAMLFAF